MRWVYLEGRELIRILIGFATNKAWGLGDLGFKFKGVQPTRDISDQDDSLVARPIECYSDPDFQAWHPNRL